MIYQMVVFFGGMISCGLLGYIQGKKDQELSQLRVRVARPRQAWSTKINPGFESEDGCPPTLRSEE